MQRLAPSGGSREPLHPRRPQTGKNPEIDRRSAGRRSYSGSGAVLVRPVVGATGIEPVTPSMSTRCLQPNTLRLFEFLKAFVAFFAVCSRRIVAVRCRERLSFSESHSRDFGRYPA